ncbi:MAG: methyltransferase domain-containing protein [Hyphomicrobiales bacterium]|nr:methyltransferase domain-containing protein [Hyphomicrobiales bacterium]
MHNVTRVGIRFHIFTLKLSHVKLWHWDFYREYVELNDAGHEDEYDDTLIALLELIWGEGFLSPGGPQAVRDIVKGLDLKDKLVLDIGCGLGGLDVILATDYGARVIGLDVEQELVKQAVERVERAGLIERVSCRLSEPGPLPLDDEEVDVVFGKDSWIHIEDKNAFFSEAFRVLKPGGILTAGDWMRSDKPYGNDMKYFFEMEGLTYHMDTLGNYGEILRDCGFTEITLEDIADDYRNQALQEYAAMQGPLKQQMINALGEEKQAFFVENWRALTVVLDAGELRPARFRAYKPG